MRAAGLLCVGLVVVLGGCSELRESWRQMGPRPQYRVAVRIPIFEEGRLPNGMRVAVYHEPYLPLVSVRLVSSVGAAAAPANQAGLAQLTYRLLMRGPEGMDSDVALDEMGTAPSISVSHDGAVIGLRARAQRLGEVLDILGEALQRPRLDEGEFTRLKAMQLDMLGQDRMSPQQTGYRILQQVIYGAEHPYGKPPEGTAAAVTGLRREDAAAFYGRFVGPANTVLVLAGRVKLAEALALAGQSFGAWRSAAVAPPSPPPPQVRRREVIWYVPWPGLSQTLLFLGRYTTTARSADALAVREVSPWLGGRIASKLRTEKGVTYAASSTAVLMRSGGHLLAVVPVQADATGTSIRTALDASDRLHTGAYQYMDTEAGQEALYAMRAGLVSRIVAPFRGLSDSADAVAELYQNGRQMSSHQEDIRRAMGLHGQDLREAMARYMAPGTMQMVLVGDPEVIGDQVRGDLREWSE